MSHNLPIETSPDPFEELPSYKLAKAVLQLFMHCKHVGLIKVN